MQHADPSTDDIEQLNRAHTYRWFEAMSNTDIASLGELMAEDVELNTSPSTRDEPRRGHAEVLGRLERVFTSGRYYQPGTFQWQVHDVIAEGDTTASRASATAAFPNGNPYANEYLVWQRWRDGKMTYMLELFDPTHWANQRNADQGNG
jgi:ketosteroid isomerase-like protein